MTDSLRERLSRQEFRDLLGRFTYYIWFVGAKTLRVTQLYQTLPNYSEGALRRLDIVNYILNGDIEILERAQLSMQNIDLQL